MEGQNGEDENEVSALVFVSGCCGFLFVQDYTIELIPQTSELDMSTSSMQVLGDYILSCHLHNRITWTLIP